eukprot:scaffold10485_cov106-Skeletonema_dohrnii-CCMP3373.AAC.10
MDIFVHHRFYRSPGTVVGGMILATYLRLKYNHIVKCCLLDVVAALGCKVVTEMAMILIGQNESRHGGTYLSTYQLALFLRSLSILRRLHTGFIAQFYAHKTGRMTAR